MQLTEEQKMLRDMVREFTKKEIEPRDKWMDENGFDWDLYHKIAAAGFMGANIPEEFGGGGGGIMDTTIIAHEMAKGSASIATFMGAHWLGANLVLENGTDEQRAKYMPEAAAGKIFAFGLTESSAGSDAAGIKSIATETEDGWVLNGSKAWITNSGVADYYIILAMTDPELGTKGISAFLMDKNVEGLIVGKFEEKMGCRGSATCELSFNNIKLPKEALLGVRGKGFKMAMETLDIGRITAAAICAGIAEHATTMAAQYANERKAFGKPIKAFQGVAFRFADMYAETKAMEFLAYDAAATKDAGQRCTLNAAAAKLFATEHCVDICIQAQQVFGGNGYSKEYHIERLIRDARGWCVMEGSTEILRMIVSGNVLA
ncbi:MAG TPA: acyl-CoA dehydrogenase family protein [Candidatus Scatomorpha merdipullorum]|uniref:Acyl-CoA dehydrogenase family protein n=1 Tax=Candidatus Scatomorpha merdipullorum TaxID=2840927 RepID=A0A9D1JUH6_9FIRM|nr:acyl-CoA dehydrogenase family protein [Candidatus Scatomorpha merdipullorum]